jgi:hypothetical protein
LGFLEGILGHDVSGSRRHLGRWSAPAAVGASWETGSSPYVAGSGFEFSGRVLGMVLRCAAPTHTTWTRMRGLRWSAVGPTSAAPVVNDSYMHPGASVPLSKHLLFRRRRSSGTGQMLVVRWNSVPRAACHLGITLYFRATIYCGATQQDLCSTEHIAARKPPQLLIRDTCIVTRCFFKIEADYYSGRQIIAIRQLRYR